MCRHDINMRTHKTSYNILSSESVTFLMVWYQIKKEIQIYYGIVDITFCVRCPSPKIGVDSFIYICGNVTLKINES